MPVKYYPGLYNNKSLPPGYYHSDKKYIARIGVWGITPDTNLNHLFEMLSDKSLRQNLPTVEIVVKTTRGSAHDKFFPQFSDQYASDARLWFKEINAKREEHNADFKLSAFLTDKDLENAINNYDWKGDYPDGMHRIVWDTVSEELRDVFNPNEFISRSIFTLKKHGIGSSVIMEKERCNADIIMDYIYETISWDEREKGLPVELTHDFRENSEIWQPYLQKRIPNNVKVNEFIVAPKDTAAACSAIAQERPKDKYLRIAADHGNDTDLNKVHDFLKSAADWVKAYNDPRAKHK
jgi:hypothetical protein